MARIHSEKKKLFTIAERVKKCMLAAVEEVVKDNQVRDQVISVTLRLKLLLLSHLCVCVCECVCISLPVVVS